MNLVGPSRTIATDSLSLTSNHVPQAMVAALADCQLTTSCGSIATQVTPKGHSRPSPVPSLLHPFCSCPPYPFSEAGDVVCSPVPPPLHGWWYSVDRRIVGMASNAPQPQPAPQESWFLKNSGLNRRDHGLQRCRGGSS